MIPRYEPMLAKDALQPFSGKDWIFEIKWDGYRAIAYINSDLSLRSRNGKELRYNFPELEELRQIARNVVVDGEIVVMKDGKADFQTLQERAKQSSPQFIQAQTARSPATYVVFDILEKNGISLVNLPLTERKKELAASVKEGKHTVLSDYVEEKGEDYYRIALERGIEGVVAKKKDSKYEPGVRGSTWLKIKKLHSCDCVIFGYTKGTGARANSFGALILGLFDKESNPVHVGKVGTGFSDETLKDLSRRFEKSDIHKAPFANEIPNSVVWVKPTLVCEVLYQVVTNDGKLRMPRFHGLRTDKLPAECKTDQILQNVLGSYQKKRDFEVTSEPKGEIKMNMEPIFVIQEHHARRLHFDLRLEKDGVLKSWAVPKGIPESPEQKRLAVQVEDHPLDYANFEGSIPEGQYGAGTVTIWDKGTFNVKRWGEDTIEFIPKGKKLAGRYVLVRLKKTDQKNWLLLKAKE